MRAKIYFQKFFSQFLGALVLILALSLMSESFDLLGSLAIILFILGYDMTSSSSKK